MNRRYTGIIIGLLALAAAEFGLLGADAAGITGGGGGGVPPVVERGVVVGTATPTATATPPLQTPFPLTPISPPSADITGAFLQADPLTIACDGSQESTVTVRLVQSNGDPAPDGTWVYASAYNGSAYPWDGAETVDGYATFTVRFYDDVFPYGPNFIVNSGLLQAGIRIRCTPVSDGGCPPSPPATSPPCGSTPTPTPFPCNPSPGSGPETPPCGPTSTPTPYPCNPSPGSGPLSPPCEGQYTSPLVMMIDCDTGRSGIQDNCFVNKAAGAYDIEVLVRNTGDTSIEIAAFDGWIEDTDISRLGPVPGIGNPEFTAFPEPNAWNCLAIAQSAGFDPGKALSQMHCFDAGFSAPLVLVPGGIWQLYRVHYQIPPDAEPGELVLNMYDGGAYDPTAVQLGICSIGPDTPLENPMECRGATVHLVDVPATPAYTATATPTAGNFELALDCDLGQAGIQDSCSVPLSDGTLDVGVVLSNVGEVDETLAAFNFRIRDPNESLLSPPAIAGGFLDRNPNFNQADLPGDWACDPISNDVLQADPALAVSLISCYMAGAFDEGPRVPAGGQLRVASIHYGLKAAGGPVTLGIEEANFYNRSVEEIGSCNPVILKPFAACRNAFVTVRDGAAEGPLATATAASAGTPLVIVTSTPVPIVTSTPVPVVTSTPMRTATRPAVTATHAARTATGVATATATRKAGRRCGDVNGDGRVTLEDVRLIARQILRGLYDQRYDVNGDGRVSTKDAMRAIRQLGRRC